MIEFKNVSFRYPGETSANPLVLQHLSFTIKPGEKIALVGVNGSGKTTLISYCVGYMILRKEVFW